MSAGRAVEPLLAARRVVQEFASTRRRAVDDVSFDLFAGETLGLIGESGAGKSTLARALLQLPRPTSGSVLFRGADLCRLKGRRLVTHRRGMQIVFQDPFASFNPKWRVGRIVAEPFVAGRVGDRRQRAHRVAETLDRVGLPPAVFLERRPRELSGGQCQRVAIARALVLKPALIVCDEAVASLDVLVQAQMLSLLRELRAELGLTYLFISHDLATLREIADRVAVLHLGQLCEIGPAPAVYGGPLHPYTAALLAAARGRSELREQAGVGEVANERVLHGAPTEGCRFRSQCPRAQARCALEKPRLRPLDEQHFVACHFPLPARVSSAAGMAPVEAAACPVSDRAPRARVHRTDRGASENAVKTRI